MKNIHPAAIVHPDATIEEGVVIEAFAVIDSPYVILRAGVRVKSHAFITGHVEIGRESVIWPFASIGADTQDKKFKGEMTFVKIGEKCHIRESVTINSSCGEGTSVLVGDHCLIMAYCHVAHNCEVGNYVVMANSATLAGHVKIGDYAVLGGLCAIHQHTRIGEHAMVGGGSMVGQDLPPFCLGSGFPLRAIGLNIVGLRRRGFTLEDRKRLIRAYRLTFEASLSWSDARLMLLEEMPDDLNIQKWIQFCDRAKRGLVVARHQKKEWVEGQMEENPQDAVL